MSICSLDFRESSLYLRMLLNLEPRTLMGVLLPLGMMGNPYWSTSPEGAYLARPDASSSAASSAAGAAFFGRLLLGRWRWRRRRFLGWLWLWLRLRLKLFLLLLNFLNLLLVDLCSFFVSHDGF